MAVVIVAILLIGFLIIATEKFNHMNKAAVAMFAGVVCWLLYIGYGARFVISEHPIDFLSFLSNNSIGADSVKEFIASSVFGKYILSSAEIVLFLLGTMTIVEVLDNNGCFDFIAEWLRMSSPRRFLWVLAGITFVISANLNNISTICMMLSVMHTMVARARLRMLYGVVIVLAANCGGAFTVIGDITSLSLWVNGLVTPTAYSSMLVVSCVVALTTTLALMSRNLPQRLELNRTALPYRGDDTVLTRGQRLLLLLVGVGGLWFIPTFHRITHLPPFVGALCVLSLLWIINELCNRSLLGSDQMVRKRMPMALQYANIQNMLFFIGVLLALGAVKETGMLDAFYRWSLGHIGNCYVLASVAGLLSGIFNNVAMLLSCIYVYADGNCFSLVDDSVFAGDSPFWALTSYSTAVGGSLLIMGTMGGYLLMRMEEVSFSWYLRHITGKVFLGWLAGMGVFYLLFDCFK